MNDHDGWGDFALELSDRLPFCGCGRGDEFTRSLYDYLSGDGAPTLTYDDSDPLAELIAHIAAGAGLTEHGTHILWSWRTPFGDRALEMWAARGIECWAYKGDRPASAGSTT